MILNNVCSDKVSLCLSIANYALNVMISSRPKHASDLQINDKKKRSEESKEFLGLWIPK